MERCAHLKNAALDDRRGTLKIVIKASRLPDISDGTGEDMHKFVAVMTLLTLTGCTVEGTRSRQVGL